MHRRSLHALIAAVSSVGLLSAACSSSVKVVPFEGADSNPDCLALTERWPSTAGGQQARVTAADSEMVQAWGDPAIIGRCGAPPPGPTTDQCLDIDGVDWVATELDDGVRFTTYGRNPAIEVLVPDDYQPEALVMPAFADVARAMPRTGGECS